MKPLTDGSPSDWARAQRIAKTFVEGDGAVLHKRLLQQDAADAAFSGGGHYPHNYAERYW